MATSKLIRNIPKPLEQKILKTIPPGMSQQEHILRLLEAGVERKQSGDPVTPFLFEAHRPQPPSPVQFTFIDLFAGIGGFRIGMTMNGGRCVFTSEWDKYSQKTYSHWFGETEIHGDINKVEPASIPDHDILCAGFPCQPFSIAGVSKKNSMGRVHGFQCEKQGNLFFRICDIVDAKRPPVLFLENVKNLRSHDKGKTWAIIKSELESRNYKVFDKTVDAKAWVPQHRERIFIVCFDRAIFGDQPPFEFPQQPDMPQPLLGDILESSPPKKYTLSDNLWVYLQGYAKKHQEKGNGFGFGLVGPEDTTRTLSARYYKDGSEILIRQGKKQNPRRLTHREAARLMGYTDRYARAFGHENGFPVVVSDTQAYKQFGNSVVPPVIEAVAKQIVDVINWQVKRSGNGCLMKGRVASATPAHRKVV